MANRATKLGQSLFHFYPWLFHSSLIHSISSLHSVEETVRAAVEAKSYKQLPDILLVVEKSGHSPNPFSFLSTYPFKLRTQIIDEILQSFRSIRPRSHPHIAYDLLLSYTLQSPHPLPVSLAILQCTLRAGCSPAPQIRLLLSSAWLNCQGQSVSVSRSLLEMQDIGYSPDSVMCNYLISSLCAVDRLEDAVKVLKGMSSAGCLPNLDSYASLITSMCSFRRTADAVELMKQMVNKARLSPRQGMVVKLVATLRANKEIWKAVEMIEFLEREGNLVGFESYQLVVEGCLECREYVLAGKAVMAMTDKGFIPYIKVRQKVIEGLVYANELKLASLVRERFVDLGS